ncbi:235_t:CDS:1, partial [Dentiscutata heterogama]
NPTSRWKTRWSDKKNGAKMLTGCIIAYSLLMWINLIGTFYPLFTNDAPKISFLNLV